jgi:conjugative relaxase-like TrwC/TraI family protein
MTVHVRISPGRDAGYPFRQMGGWDARQVGSQRGAGYYLSAVEKQGEPVGFWVGEGAADLGFHDGDIVRAEDFVPLYGRLSDPRDPSGRTYLGGPLRKQSNVEDLYQRKLQAEARPLTEEVKEELWQQARAEVKGAGVPFFDATFSADKTLSLAHATAKAAAQAAFEAGDLDSCQEWDERAAGIWQEILGSVRVFIDHVQKEAGFVRTGHHGQVNGVRTGKTEDAHEIPVAVFPQHVSRDGDPQLHVHILFLNRVKTVRDGAWRAVDSRALHRVKSAGAALAALHLESKTAERYGFSWVFRPRSNGRVIEDVPDNVIKAFASRSADIDAKVRPLVRAYEATHGHAPSRRGLTSMRQYVNDKHRPRKEGTLDWRTLLRDWEQRSRDRETGTLRDLARSIWRHADAADMRKQPGITPGQERAAMQAGLREVQASSACWGRMQLIWAIGKHLPDHVTADSAQEKLNDMASRVLAGEAGTDVVRLDIPDYPVVPETLRRADGESVYRPHNAERYATVTQLSTEEQLLADMRRQNAPRIAPDVAAKLLGTTAAQIHAWTHADADADAADSAQTETGLSPAEAIVAFRVLTSGRTGEVVIGGAGTGKSHVSAEMAKVWRQAGMGRVIGLASTSAARNVLIRMGITESYNLHQFLGHLPGQPGARGAIDIGRDALIILDEASQAPLADTAAVARHAARSGSKLVPVGDIRQLESVEGGGALEMAAHQNGYHQLPDPVRFEQQWERDASMRLRAGDASALRDYDHHGRLHGGSYEEMAEYASRMYLAEHLAGTDVLLTAYSREECRDLSRRIQGYLREWGKLGIRVSVRLREDVTACQGDLVIARKNDNRLQAGATGWTLSNSDMLRIQGAGPEKVTVRRMCGHDPQTGQRRWSAPFQVSRDYLAEHADLGYALTWHTVQGATVTKGLTLASDQREARGFYESLTRGRAENHAFGYRSDPGHPGDCPAEDTEVARDRRLQAERAGQASTTRESADPLPIFAAIASRDGGQLSATETRQRALADADHFGHLWVKWQDNARRLSGDRFTAAVRSLLTPRESDEVLADTDDLFRALRAAELAGRDGAQTLRIAVLQGDFTGARSKPAVLAARVRRLTESLPPKPSESWASQVPHVADPDMARFLADLGQAMDERQRREAQHAADNALLWAAQALGPVPEDQRARGEWQRSAEKIIAYRGASGWNHAGQALGPEPGTTSPELQALWHHALAAMTRSDGVNAAGLSDGQLLAQRRAFERETAHAPRHVADELRLIRRQETLARVEAARYSHQAETADRHGQDDRAARHHDLARSYQALENLCRQQRELLASAHDTRQQWEAMTEPTRRMAISADDELKRRGVLRPDDKIRVAEPAGLDRAENHTGGQWVQERLDGGSELAAEPREPSEPESIADRDQRGLEALGLTLGHLQEELPLGIRETVAYSRERQAELDQRSSQMVPDEDPDYEDIGPAWSRLADREREAILQPPPPQIPPAEELLELFHERGDKEMSS